jgi:histidyl-tRNA synthetase
MLTARPKGTNDIMLDQIEKWQYLEGVIREICSDYGYTEIRTPIFEHTELFHRGVGDTTDVVEKEMYTFEDKGKRSISLRPEGTASTVRAFVEHKLYGEPQPVKVFYQGPMFRYANVQAGRYRQFHQFGVEVFGSNDPATDAEVISMAMDLYNRVGLKNLELHINSVGCPTCRADHSQALHDYLNPRLEKLCKLCQSRFERNPMRILDCKAEVCQQESLEAPTTTKCLCPDCAEHFNKVKAYLDSVGVEYIVDERLVRGLDYYTHTAFEIMASDIGAQSSIGGGGRYNGLIEQVGGPSTPGIGYALGIERILNTMERQGVEIPTKNKIDVFIATLGDEAKAKAFVIVNNLRKQGISTELDSLGRSLKAQMKYANRLNAKYTLILGEDELNKGVAVVRNMADGSQEEVKLESIADFLQL